VRGQIPDNVIENWTESLEEPGFDPVKLTGMIHSVNRISDRQGNVP
jgi:hypothetical protein